LPTSKVTTMSICGSKESSPDSQPAEKSDAHAGGDEHHFTRLLSLPSGFGNLTPESAAPCSRQDFHAGSSRDAQMNRANSQRRAARIALIYLLLGGLWIVASDQVLLSIFPGLSEEALTVYQTSKGLVFIVVTTFVLYILSLRNTRMQDEILKQLNSTDRLYNELLVNSPVGVYRVNPQGIPVHLNAQARELLRLGTTPLTAKWFDQIHPQDRQRIREAWQTALDTKTRFHQEYRIGGDPLSPMWLVDTAHCQLNEEGDFVGYLGTLTDITDLRVTQMAERELQERLHATIAAAHVGLWDM